MKLLSRPRRNRKSESIRTLLEDVVVTPQDIVAPLYVVEGKNQKTEVRSMPGVFRRSIDSLLNKAEELHKKGIQCICLFPSIDPNLKDFYGSEAINENGLIPKAVRLLKRELPTLSVMTDVALDPYTTHGHDGIPDQSGYIENDKTLRMLKMQAVIQAHSGVDIIAPSDMMDGRVLAIRETLDNKGYENVSILSYSSKYASKALYSPFREALQSTPSKGDKNNYQLSPKSSKEGILEALIDVDEGADILLVKPGLPYLDILYRLKQQVSIPVGAFHVSGEYSMIKAAEKLGYINAKHAFEESMIAFKRAGADFIITYCFEDFLN